MSIRDVIERLCREGKLCDFPIIGPRQGPRRLFLSKDVAAILDPDTWDDSEETDLYVRAYGRLEAYARHDDISFGWDPDEKEPHAAFARVKDLKLHVVSVRAWTNDKRHIRLFGCFSEKDWFIVLLWDFREELDFDERAIDCRNAWHELFDHHPPHYGDSVHDYLSCFVTSV